METLGEGYRASLLVPFHPTDSVAKLFKISPIFRNLFRVTRYAKINLDVVKFSYRMNDLDTLLTPEHCVSDDASSNREIPTPTGTVNPESWTRV